MRSFHNTAFSNFWNSPVQLDGLTYPSVEHAFQAAKTLDPKEREPIRLAKTPGAAKRFGRKVTLRPGWNEMRLEVMEGLLRQKWSQEPFKTLLIETGDEELVEGNTWRDTFWGVWNGQGENHLGKLLMKLRSELSALPSRQPAP